MDFLPSSFKAVKVLQKVNLVCTDAHTALLALLNLGVISDQLQHFKNQLDFKQPFHMICIPSHLIPLLDSAVATPILGQMGFPRQDE